VSCKPGGGRQTPEFQRKCCSRFPGTHSIIAGVIPAVGTQSGMGNALLPTGRLTAAFADRHTKALSHRQELRSSFPMSRLPTIYPGSSQPHRRIGRDTARWNLNGTGRGSARPDYGIYRSSGATKLNANDLWGVIRRRPQRPFSKVQSNRQCLAAHTLSEASRDRAWEQM
jgi:hypothetical protein